MLRLFWGFTWGVFTGTVVFSAGCGLILGLDEFVDQPAPDGTECASPQDCASGEHGSPTCEEGVCGFVCEEGFDDCDEAVGCEADTRNDEESCGGCEVKCSAYCVEGSCNDPVYASVGSRQACAILKDGSLWCWGFDPERNIVRRQPMQMPLTGSAVQVRVSAAVYYWFEVGHACVVLADGDVQCWGPNTFGQLGLGHTTDTWTLTHVSVSKIRQIALGGYHTCAVDQDGRLFCWGWNSNGQIGDGSTTTALLPVQVLDSVAQVAAGAYHTCAAMIDGSVRCWGRNNLGQLGITTQMDKLIPTPVPMSDVVDLACGTFHSCVRTEFGVHCWGFNLYGQLGLNSNDDQLAPQALRLGGVDAIGAGAGHTGALANGELLMWGLNATGQLGDGTAANSLVPKAIGMHDVDSMALGTQSSCALTRDRVLLCWGDNDDGLLGDGTTNGRPTPGPVAWP